MKLTTGAICFLLLLAASTARSDVESSKAREWIQKPQSEWPHIALINEIEYTDHHHPIAGCGFLLDTGGDTLAVTAKHVLTFFKSDSMTGVSFGNTLRTWKMYPKDAVDALVVVDRLLNEDAGESIEAVPSSRDWLLFSLKAKSPNIQPLRIREEPLIEGESVYIVGWRYSDKDCPQVIYTGAYVRSEDGTILISTDRLADNTMPGLSGAPVIDSNGDLIGLMSQKAGKLERLSSVEYPRSMIASALEKRQPAGTRPR